MCCGSGETGKVIKDVASPIKATYPLREYDRSQFYKYPCAVLKSNACMMLVQPRGQLALVILRTTITGPNRGPIFCFCGVNQIWKN